jgi:MFS family permease
MLSRGGFGILTGWTTDKYGPRIAVAIGGLFIGLGLMLTSQSALWQLYIFYSLLVGLGVGVAFAPLVSTVARWFLKKRGLATGIVLAGIGLGTAIMPVPAAYLIETYGWSVSYIIIGIIALFGIVLAALLLRRSPEEMGLLPYGSNVVDKPYVTPATVTIKGVTLRDAIGTRSFWVLFIITILFSTCLYMIMVHIVPHSRDLGISGPVAGSFLAMIGIGTIFGRLVGGWLADAIGRRRHLPSSYLFRPRQYSHWWELIVSADSTPLP